MPRYGTSGNSVKTGLVIIMIVRRRCRRYRSVSSSLDAGIIRSSFINYYEVTGTIGPTWMDPPIGAAGFALVKMHTIELQLGNYFGWSPPVWKNMHMVNYVFVGILGDVAHSAHLVGVTCRCRYRKTFPTQSNSDLC